METLNMSHTRGFGIGGMLHIITNNQVGFTTSLPADVRSTLYSSDIGKMLELPIFHVNADDPEAVYKVTCLALAYRTLFKKDVIIDLMGYRRYGHNEADEPMVTQPIMYQIIRQLPPVFKKYSEALINEQLLSKPDIDQIEKAYRDELDKRQNAVAKDLINHEKQDCSVDWSEYFTQDWRIAVETGVKESKIKHIAEKMCQLPMGFMLHARVQKIIEERKAMTMGNRPLDWGYGEIMAYATLLDQAYFVRLCGQDTGRGTFFHRHAVLHNQVDGSEYIPLAHISENQGHVDIIDSILSETAVVAFEYGFASTEPRGLVVWEAQFGDFANNAQVVVDQFISSGEQKWGRLCGLVMLLPHGYEGQGPEHSSARLERYLQLCAQNNMQVCVPSTPAQIFHLLRRQVIRPMRKPLIVMTPKSFLRHKSAVSALSDLESGSFLPIISEMELLDKAKIKRVILCSGKVYYDLLDARRLKQIDHIAIIRIEQLYPFPDKELASALIKYDNVTDIIWCQEEPENQGAWYCSQHHFKAALRADQTLRYVGRQPSAASSVGYIHLHTEQQIALVNEALGIEESKNGK
jgi:2-oxoglutarate dehydrogenase E1 component